jgi:tetratricopeptide (TPR) repeat protein/CHAT domain-containing protein
MLNLWRLWGCGLAVLLALAVATPASAQTGGKTAADADRLNAVSAMLYKEGKYSAAIALALEALAIRETTLGPDHPSVGASLSNLAELYRAQGRNAEAEPLYKRSLALFETTLGPEHASVATLLNNLAELYRAQGRYAEGEPLYQRSLALSEKALGGEHPSVATSLNNLAALYEVQGRFAEAEPLNKRSLALLEKALGPDHPDVATSLNNLAGLYEAQGRYSEAEPLYKRSLALQENARGPEHPSIATVLNNLALLYKNQGRFAVAEPLYKRSLALREKVLGPEHPSVATSLNNLAALYEAQGRFAEAEPLYGRGLALTEKALGPEHPSVATSLNNLAGLYAAQGRYTEAEPLYGRGLRVFEKAHGPKHPSVATTLSNLAGLCKNQGRFAEAEALYRRGLGAFENALEPEHPSVVTAVNNLALLLQHLGRFTEAGTLHKRSLALIERALGPDHPNVAASLDNLAALALGQSDFAGAAESWRRATLLMQRRTERGLGSASRGTSKGEAQQRGWYFDRFVKTTHRLTTTAAGEEANRRAAEMFETAQWARSSEAAASLTQMAARSAKGSPGLAALVRDRQDLVSEWQAKDALLIAARSEPPARRHAASEKALGDRLTAIDARLAAIDSQLAKDFPDYAALASTKPVPVAEVQASLRDDEALLLFLDTDDRFEPLPEETFIWVVTKTDVRWLRSDLGTVALRREVAALRCGLDATNWIDASYWPERDAGETKLKKEQLVRRTLCRDLTGVEASATDVLPFDTARAHALYQSLLGKAAALIKRKHLLVVPSGALTTLPFQVLVIEGGQNDGAAPNVRDARWLIREHAVTVLPSVSALTALRRTGKQSTAPKPMIGFANPLLDGNQAHPRDGAWYAQQAQLARAETGCASTHKQRTAALRAIRRSPTPVPHASGLADLAHLKLQTPLPETAEEVCDVARSIGADVSDMRIGARANETEVKRLSQMGDLASYRILHFATHGLLAGQLSGTREPGLILTPPAAATPEDDGYLSGSEIADLKLDADWVILSACNTAGGAGQGEAAEALSGLARVFFYAGARALLVSHWEVDSSAAVRLVTGAIGTIAKDKTIGRAEALRRAMLSAMVDASRPTNWVPAWHPSVWAPFVVVGEGAAAQ